MDNDIIVKITPVPTTPLHPQVCQQLCRYHYRCHSYRHRHAMYPTQQPDQYFRHLPVCLQSGKYDFHDHLLHRRLFGYLPCRKQLADLGWSGVVGTGVILTIISFSITLSARNNNSVQYLPYPLHDKNYQIFAFAWKNDSILVISCCKG